MAGCIQNGNALMKLCQAYPSKQNPTFGRVSLVFLGGLPFFSKRRVFQVSHDSQKTHFSTNYVLTIIKVSLDDLPNKHIRDNAFLLLAKPKACNAQCLCLLADGLTNNMSAHVCHLNSISNSDTINISSPDLSNE